MSFDAPSTNAIFKANEEFVFPLWSDTEKSLALTYGAAEAAWQPIASRITVILDEEGDWVLFYPSNVVQDKSLYLHALTVLDDLALLVR